MPAKHSTTNREQLVKDLRRAAAAYVNGGDGRVLDLKSVEIVPHKGMEFDIVIRCIGTRPKWNN